MSLSRSLLLIAAAALAPAFAFGAQSPSSVESDELAAQAGKLTVELATLEAGTAADFDALRVTERDLRETLELLAQPLPPIPASLSQIEYPEREVIERVLGEAQAFRAAWEEHHGARARAGRALDAAAGLAEGLREAHVALVDSVLAARPILIELQRRVVRGDLEVEALGLGGGRTVAEWVVRSAELVKDRRATLLEIEAAVAAVDEDRKAFEALPEEDPEIAREARRIGVALTTIAEATAAQVELMERLAAARPETIPTELERTASEWTARRAALESTAQTVVQQLEAFEAVRAEGAALQAPRLKDIPGGEGVEEVRAARRDVELSTRMIAFYEREIELLGQIETLRGELIAAAEDASKKHASFSRQTARLLETFDHATERVARGELVNWVPPESVTEHSAWVAWRDLQFADVERVELLDRLLEEAGSGRLTDDTSLLAKERETLKRTQARLETELSYAEFTAGMADLSEADLIALVAADGEVARALVRTEAEVAEAVAGADAARVKCLAAVRAVESVESPYSRIVLQRRASQLAPIRELLASLEDGAVPPDRSAALVPTDEDRPNLVSKEDLHDGTKASPVALAEKERAYIEREQQFARVSADYYGDFERARDSLRVGIEEYTTIQERREELLRARTRELKRGYAAALELIDRQAEGRLEAALPEHTVEWARRDAMQAANEELRAVVRDGDRFRSRANYELERFDRFCATAPWMRIRMEGADARARTIGRPVSHLASALTPLDELRKVDHKRLEYEARATQSNEAVPFERAMERFTDDEARARFEEPLDTYQLELANTRRVRRDFADARAAYEQMVAMCVSEQEQLEPVRGVVVTALEQRLLDYHAARYAAAVVAQPGSRARLEESFRREYGRELPYRLGQSADDVMLAADLLFGAEVRLIGQHALVEDVDLYLSKLGIGQEIGWYQSQMARIGALLETEEGNEDLLAARIAELRQGYLAMLKENAVRGLAWTLAIPLIAYLLVRILHRATRRFEGNIEEEEENADRKRRLKTISKTSTAAVAVLIWVIAVVYVFARLGLDITPIVASASVVGLAVAFGAQALIKDFFYGFFILIENQFTIGDIVKLGTVSGTVEQISLRITVLRDLEGVVHYIPNGSIGQVSNKTQGWSRVVTEISVRHREDSDHVTDVLREVLNELAADAAWRRRILGSPEVLGVEGLNERSMDIRVMIKTRPGKQWEVAREARRRIKHRFDELGIEIPLPQRIIHHVYDDDRPEEEGRPGSEPPAHGPRRTAP